MKKDEYEFELRQLYQLAFRNKDTRVAFAILKEAASYGLDDIWDSPEKTVNKRLSIAGI